MITAACTIATVLDRDVQLRIVQDVRLVLKAAPLFRPLARGGQPMSVQVSSAGHLGWVGDKDGYRYRPRQADGQPWPPIPKEWVEIADRVAGPHPWDSAIINWYSPTASLGWHRDLSEFDLSLPIVTIMIGDACSWAIKSDEHAKASRCKPESGSVSILAGPTRNYFHSVERIIADPLFSPLAVRGRISITLRVAGDPGIVGP